jgi:hypothetical protein
MHTEQALSAAVELGGRMATPVELRRLLGLLAGFPTSEQQDRRLLKVLLHKRNAGSDTYTAAPFEHLVLVIDIHHDID